MTQQNNPASESRASRVVAVLVDGFDNWGGGLDFIRLILNGLLVDRNLQVRLLIPQSTRRSRLRAWLGVLWRSAKSALKGRPRWQQTAKFEASRVAAAFADFGDRVRPLLYPGSHAGLVQALASCGAQVALPSIKPLGQDFPIPWVGYIFDFQHRHLPGFFTELACEERHRAFERMLNEAKVVLVNARAVRADSEEVFPGSSGKIVCMPFAPSPKPEWLNLSSAPVLSARGLPRRYFIVCNQFWAHKDHATVFKAYARYRTLGGDPAVGLVCTGGLHDLRAPDHLARMEDLIASLGISNQVHLLGHIPKTEQIALLRDAIAVLQPSLYEGGPGGGAVYDAVSLGVPSLVSDIPVNREIVGGNIRLFPPQDADSLARLMISAASEPVHRVPDEQLLLEASHRLARLSEALDTAMRMAGSVPADGPPHSSGPPAICMSSERNRGLNQPR